MTKWIDVGAVGPDGHESFKMRVCDWCNRPVDVCECDRVRVPKGRSPAEVKKLLDEEQEWWRNK